MAQLSGDSFAAGQALLPVDDAVRLLLARVPPVEEIEEVALEEADGRVLARAVVAPLDLPGFDNSAVDGYAVCFDDLRPSGETVLPVSGRVAAGHAPDPNGAEASAVRIFTGAPMPAACDTVFMQEDCRLDAEGQVVLPPGLSRGANARPRGEDVAAGSLALAAGLRLAPEHVALAAALGMATLPLRRALRVAVFSTGDEIMAPGAPPRPAGTYDANRFFLAALLRRLGVVVTDLGILPDNVGAIDLALRRAAPAHDLVVTSGGVSTGEEDHVKAAVDAAGSLVFWRVGIKPGRPVALGIVDGTPFIGLPGNPVAVFVTFAVLVRPLLAALAGEAWTAPTPIPVVADFSYRKKKGRREYVRVRLEPDARGQLRARKFGIEGAGVLSSLTETHGLVELDEEITAVAPGDRVGFLGYASLR